MGIRRVPATAELRRMARLHREIDESTDLPLLLGRVVEEVSAITQAARCGLWLERDSALHLTASAGEGGSPLPEVDVVGVGQLGNSFANHQPVVIDEQDPEMLWLSTVLEVGATPVGLLATRGPLRPADDELRVLRTVARALGQRFEKELGERVDSPRPQTIRGRGPFERRLAQEVSRAGNGAYPFSLMVLKMHGYLDAGLLRRVSDLFRSVDECFETDLGEFAILMPHTNAAEAAAAGRRVGGVVLAESGDGVWLSLGIAERETDDPTKLEYDARSRCEKLTEGDARARSISAA
jgi:hypothetical protein